MSPKALITGGAGFVGHHLAELLLRERCQVLALDDFSVGTRENVAPLIGRPGFELALVDVTDAEATVAAVAEFEPDIVFHLAATHFIPYCRAHPTETVATNVLGTQNVLEAVRGAASVRKLVFASTADIYQPQDGPNVEDETPTGSLNIYGVTKLLGEGLIGHYREVCPDVSFVIARFCNVYGPGETNPHVLPDILDAMTESDALPLGNVEPKRDLVYVTDVTEALWALADLSVPSTVVNVGTSREYSVRELVERIAALTGRSLVITRDPARFRESERMHLVSDIRKIRELTGWSPRHSLDDGLTELLECEGFIEPQGQAGRQRLREAV